jgi:hypothetical protein
MASFAAELELNGQTRPVRSCRFEFGQVIDTRGRVRGKVRHGLIHIVLDVPEDDALLDWANSPTKALAGHVTFFETNRPTARETLSFSAGHCVGYAEMFVSGDGDAGAYRCTLTIAAEKLEIAPGGPQGAPVPAEAREYEAPLAAAAAASADPVAALMPSKLERYNARMGMMDNARTKLTTVPDDDAQTALTRLERNNVAVERARLSAHVYKSDEFNLDELGNPTGLKEAEPEGWHMLDPQELAQLDVSPEMLLDPKSGFKAAMYQSSFERPPKLVIAYAGTEDKKDILADLRQGVGFKEKQYNEAMDLAKAVVNNTGKDSIDLTGHSLGGGLASAAAVVTGAKGYTFNAAGLHTNTVKRPPYNVSRAAMQEQSGLIDAYRSTSDPLNNFQNGLNFPGGYLAPKALGISRPVAPAAEWQHQWPELVKGNPLTAAKAMALDGHGINPQMVGHIEAEKDLDTATLNNYLAS